MSPSPNRRRFLRSAILATAGLASARRLDAVERAFEKEVRGLPSWTPGAGMQARYMLDPAVCYLNHGSIGTVPRVVHNARTEYGRICETNPWLYMWGGAWEAGREGVRAGLGRALGAPAERVAITHNTTEGFNILAQGLPFEAGDEVLFSSLNHPGASICFQHFGERRGYDVRTFRFPVEEVPGLSDADVIRIHLEQVRPRTRAVVFPHLDNMIGLRHPLAGLTRALKGAGVDYVLVDGAQTVGMIPLEVHESGVDAYAGSPHKWVQAPKGLGVLYLSENAQRALLPSWVTWGQERWAGTVRAFEDYGTRNLPEVLAMGDALDFQEGLTYEAKLRHYGGLHEEARSMTEGAGLHWYSPRDFTRGGALFAVGYVGRPAAEVSVRIARDDGVVVRPFSYEGRNWLRVSPNVVNSSSDLERFIGAVRRVLGE